MGSSMSCPDCCSCCCPSDRANGSKAKSRPDIKYLPPSEKKPIESLEEQPALEKVLYSFAQPPSDFILHPQMTATSASSDTESAADIISEQPRYFRPHSLDLPGPPPGSSSKDSSPTDLSSMSTQPTILYSLFFDIQRGILLVTLKQLFNLPPRGKHKTMDSHVEVCLLSHQHEVSKSKLVRNTLNPSFEEQFQLTGQPDMQILKKQTLIFKIFGYNKIIGMVRVKLEDADFFGETVHKRIEEKALDIAMVENIGEILFSLTYLPKAQLIQGTLLKAANLKQQDYISGTADPYVKVILYHKGKEVHKWKSAVKKYTLAPVYNEQFQMHIHNMDLADMHMDFVVMDYDRFSSDDLVGKVHIGPSVQTETGRAHWEEMVGAPYQPVSRWHPILQT